jgi:Zn-dependent M28 family amino/carboxypeptidase
MRLPSSIVLLSAVTSAAANGLAAQSTVASTDNHIVVETLRAAEALRDRTLSSDRAFDVLAALTTEIGPRLAGWPAEQRARDWIVARLRALPLDSIWTQEFVVPRWERGIDEGAIVSPHAQQLVVAAFGFSIPTPEDGVTAEVVRFPSLGAVTRATAEQARGRIIFVDRRMVRAQDGQGFALMSRDRGEAIATASRLGARALLIRSAGTSSNRVAHVGNIGYAAGVAAIPVAAVANPDADMLTAQLATGKSVRVRLVLRGRNVADGKSGNVIAELRGSERPEEVVLLGAHVDSWDLGTGALDDGAGVAIVLDAARRLTEMGARPRRTVRLVFWGAEEIGLRGARAYAATELTPARRHVLALEPDQGAGRAYRLRGQLARESAEALRRAADLLAPLGIDYLPEPSIAGPDLIPLREKGVATLDVALDMTTFFDHMHSANDTLDKVSRADFRVSATAYAVVTYLMASWPGSIGAVGTR